MTSGSVEGGIQGAVAGKNAVENNHLSTIEKITLNSKEKEYAASCNGDNSNNSSSAGLKQEISKLHKKGQGIDKNEISELGPDFQLGGVDSIEHKPGDVVSCVNSGNGFCVVTDKTAPNGQEWMLEPANKIQAITAKKQKSKMVRQKILLKSLALHILKQAVGCQEWPLRYAKLTVQQVV